jgi:hypothetical protein
MEVKMTGSSLPEYTVVPAYPPNDPPVTVQMPRSALAFITALGLPLTGGGAAIDVERALAVAHALGYQGEEALSFVLLAKEALVAGLPVWTVLDSNGNIQVQLGF